MDNPRQTQGQTMSPVPHRRKKASQNNAAAMAEIERETKRQIAMAVSIAEKKAARLLEESIAAAEAENAMLRKMRVGM